MIWLLFARIVVRVVLIALQACGIPLSVNSVIITQAAQKIENAIRASPAFQNAVRLFMMAWRQAGDSNMKKGTAIIHLLSETYSAGLLWTVIKCLCICMGWQAWMKTVGLVTTMMIASFATGGWALAAKIALIINDAVDLVADITEAFKYL